jgi:hypothetical protein
MWLSIRDTYRPFLCQGHLTLNPLLLWPSFQLPQGRLAVLDVGPASPLHWSLLHEGTRPLRTVYEEDFGPSLADVMFLPPWEEHGSAALACTSSGSGRGAGSSLQAWPSAGGSSWLGSAASMGSSGGSDGSSYGSGPGRQWQQPRSSGRPGDRPLARASWGARSRAQAASADVVFTFGRPSDCCGVYISY